MRYSWPACSSVAICDPILSMAPARSLRCWGWPSLTGQLPSLFSDIESIAFVSQWRWCSACLAGPLTCGLVRSSRSHIDCYQTGLSLPAEALAFLHGLPASLCVHEIGLMSCGPVNERICGLSIPAVAGRHTYGRSALVWLRVVESIAIHLFTEILGSVSFPAVGGGVIRAGQTRSARST